MGCGPSQSPFSRMMTLFLLLALIIIGVVIYLFFPEFMWQMQQYPGVDSPYINAP
ncbi:MAG: hypothetical protein Tsb0021_12350 [Chlamydiales bacterium]